MRLETPVAGTWTRRRFLEAFGGAAAFAAVPRLARAKLPSTPIRFTPFSQPMPRPVDVATRATFTPGCQYRPEWLNGARYFGITMKRGTVRILPGVDTEILGYDGLYPGPTIRTYGNETVFVRQQNDLDRETVIHAHGAHPIPDSDGFPADFIHPGEHRDYGYPMAPAGADESEGLSTLWYHDHTLDETGPNVYAGLAGFFIHTDELEQKLVDAGVLPSGRYDVPIVLQDRLFNRNGQLVYDFFDHDGFLGDVMVANGKAQPWFEVEPRKYRFRFLNGANARVFELRLSTRQPFLRLGADGYLFPAPIAQQSIVLVGAERADVVIDFANAPAEVFLQNVCEQDDPRGPGGSRSAPDRGSPVPLVKFVVRGTRPPKDAPVDLGTPLRPHAPILASEVQRTRRFEVERKNGAWVVNDRFYDEHRIDADIEYGATERWLLKNGGGGWWHPFHIHDEGMQIQRVNGRAPLPHERFKKDTCALAGGDEAEVFIRFRDFSGVWVFHCHNVEHEDMRMMANLRVLPPKP
jgi:FtsP/CotA-like multicopper oxidase with cupredoxin domain